MRKWEDIIKDKMEEVGDDLPEGVFEEFRDRRNGAAPVAAPRRSPLVWALVPAVAAGLAAVIFLHEPVDNDDGVQIVQKPTPPVAVVIEKEETTEQSPYASLMAKSVVPKAIQLPSERPQAVAKEGIEEDEEIEEVAAVDQTVSGEEVKEDYMRPFIHETTPSGTVKVKTAPVAGIIAGGGLIAALASPLIGVRSDYDNIIYNQNDTYESDSQGPGHVDNPEKPIDVLTGEAGHRFPVKVGLSMRIPVSKRWNLTTGVDYSVYSSQFTYSLSGKKTQIAQYVGVPVRLDWTFASTQWFEAYIGGGIEGDW